MSHQGKSYFISGHIDLSFDDFVKHYKERIQNIIEKEPQSRFVVGDAPGVDIQAQRLLMELLGNDALDRVTIYHIGDAPKNIANPKLKTMGGFPSHTAKDVAMTQISNEDIAYVRSMEESKILYGDKFDPKRISGTQRNLERRNKMNSKKN